SYQHHLWSLWQNQQKLKNIDPVTQCGCQLLLDQVLADYWINHQGRIGPASSEVGAHVEGRAFDMSIYGPLTEGQIDAIAIQFSLYRPYLHTAHPERWHFELLPQSPNVMTGSSHELRRGRVSPFNASRSPMGPSGNGVSVNWSKVVHPD